MVNNIILIGQLICQGDDEIAVVTEFLARHIELTRAEPGCISFELKQTGDPRIWDVSENFQDARSFELHQARVKASQWGRASSEATRCRACRPAPHEAALLEGCVSGSTRRAVFPLAGRPSFGTVAVETVSGPNAITAQPPTLCFPQFDARRRGH